MVDVAADPVLHQTVADPVGEMAVPGGDQAMGTGGGSQGVEGTEDWTRSGGAVHDAAGDRYARSPVVVVKRWSSTTCGHGGCWWRCSRW